MKEVLDRVPFRIRVDRRAAGKYVIVAAGEADLHAAPELDRCLRECELNEPRDVVLDLTEAELLDSTALGVLVAAHNRLATDGVELKLACANSVITRVLGITGLDRLFPIYPTPEEALDGAAPHVSAQRMTGDGAIDRAPISPGAASES